MDKIQELHAELGEKEHGNVWPEGHAAITEDMMGRFAEWVASEKWHYDGQGTYMRNDRKPNEYRNKFVRKTTSELIQIFKEQL